MGGAHASSSSPSLPRPCHALFTNIIPVFIISLITFGVAAGCGRKGELRFRQDSPDFRVALFADLHYGETAWTDWGPLQDVKSDIVISNVLDAEAPDFVVYLGDVITANNLPTPNASLYWDKAISPTRRRGIPWATVFGNHDDASFEWPSDWFSPTGTPPLLCSQPQQKCLGHGSSCKIGGVHRNELVEKEIKSNKMSCTQIGDSELWPGVSNYFLQLKSSEDSKQTAALFYFLDSGGGSYPEVISSAQASWFLNMSQELNPNSNFPEIIFWHIPSKAYEEVAPKGKINKPCVGSINIEEVAAQEAEWGIMDIISKRPTVKAIFVGHNHGLDWCCPYKALWLCYARHSGYGGYGDWPRGARMLEITQKPFSLKSWIRMEDGQKHSEIILSS